MILLPWWLQICYNVVAFPVNVGALVVSARDCIGERESNDAKQTRRSGVLIKSTILTYGGGRG